MTQQPQTEKIGGRQLVDCRALPQNLITEPGKAAMLDFERGVFGIIGISELFGGGLCRRLHDASHPLGWDAGFQA